MALFRAGKQAMNSALGASQAPSRGYKVAVLGAAGGIGQPLSLLLKMVRPSEVGLIKAFADNAWFALKEQNPMVTELALYDLKGTEGVAADISHINTPSKVTAYDGEEKLNDAVKSSDLVTIPAGMPRKPGMTRDDLFKANAGIVANLVKSVGKNSPRALINLITNPVNSTVPVAAKVLEDMNAHDPARLFGVTTLDVVRAKKFLSEEKGIDPINTHLPVVGGHAGKTILPLFSQAQPAVALDDEQTARLTKRVQEAGTEVVNAKGGAGSATVSMAYAAALFADACMRGMQGDTNVVECAYVQSSVTKLPFMASPVTLGRKGAMEVHEPGEMNEYERACFEEMQQELSDSIQRGYDFVNHEL